MTALVLTGAAAACLVIVLVGDRLGRMAFALAAAPLCVATIWTATHLGRDDAMISEFTWVGGLDLEIAFRLDGFSAAAGALVAGIGVLVCVYAAGYFSAGAAGTARFAATLLAFATAMLGLVLADGVWTMFIFWELTSITSFLLVGHARTDRVARAAARRALVITAAGGLCLLVGLVLLLDGSPGARLSDLGPVSGGTAGAAALLLLIAAATKSAQVPFHVWLPGAMAAPTPVSAYLHSATMVKAGVVLVAAVSPAFTDVAVWKPVGFALGAASMLWGAVGALRQRDAKLILAWGTVSQLGLMIALLSLGTAKATFAAIAILVAHALFKAALFMVVGEIDVRTGTRDITRLGGLWRSMPMAFAVASVSAMSMAGVPPLLGFPAKEAAVEAALGLGGGERVVVVAVVVAGSILTVAYTTRLMIGLFGGPAATEVRAARPLMSVPAVALASATLIGFLLLGDVAQWVRAAAVTIDPEASVYSLLRWPGVTTALVVSAVIVVAGAVAGRVLAARDVAVPSPVGADATDSLIDQTIATARRVAGRVQHGSLPAYVLTVVATAALAVTPFLFSLDLDRVVRWDNPAQAALVALVVAGALAATGVTTRLAAALVLGAVGLAVAGLFVAHGAPDLVLTQLLVETVVVVGFVVGLGRLAMRFPRVGGLWLTSRIVVSFLAAGAVAVGLIATSAHPADAPPTTGLIERAIADGGGDNVVNVILTDVRALDTLGEIVVLLVVAIGILTLARGRSDRDDGVEHDVVGAEPA